MTEAATAREVQTRRMLEYFGDEVDSGPYSGGEGPAWYLYRRGNILVRDEYLTEVRDILHMEGCLPTSETAGGQPTEFAVIHGVRRLRLADTTSTLEALEKIHRRIGAGAATPDHLVSISDVPMGWGGGCAPIEPTPVPNGSTPSPAPMPIALRRGRSTGQGEGIRVVILDTGLDWDAPEIHLWMDGVVGDDDPAIEPRRVPGAPYPDPDRRELKWYAGHGTFVAGLVRMMAPRAEVIVRLGFEECGASYESDLVVKLDRILRDDYPDIINLSAGALAFDPTGLLSFKVFHENRLRHHKGTVVVTAAGNQENRKPYWPAAEPWSISVGALDQFQARAEFSNYGGWVDVFAPGDHVVNAFPRGWYTYQEPPKARPEPTRFSGMARWSGTSFAAAVVSGLIATRMSQTGENGLAAAASLLAVARTVAIPGVGPVLTPGTPELE